MVMRHLVLSVGVWFAFNTEDVITTYRNEFLESTRL